MVSIFLFFILSVQYIIYRILLLKTNNLVYNILFYFGGEIERLILLTDSHGPRNIFIFILIHFKVKIKILAEYVSSLKKQTILVDYLVTET